MPGVKWYIFSLFRRWTGPRSCLLSRAILPRRTAPFRDDGRRARTAAPLSPIPYESPALCPAKTMPPPAVRSSQRPKPLWIGSYAAPARNWRFCAKRKRNRTTEAASWTRRASLCWFAGSGQWCVILFRLICALMTPAPIAAAAQSRRLRPRLRRGRTPKNGAATAMTRWIRRLTSTATLANTYPDPTLHHCAVRYVRQSYKRIITTTMQLWITR